MSGTIGKIRCKGCDKTWTNVAEYLACNGCDKGECPMSKKWKARQAANEAIQAAKDSSKEAVFVAHVKTCHIPDKHDESLPYRERPLSHCIAFHIMKR